MKKISILLFALIFGSNVFSQDAKIGIKGGLNISTWNVNPSLSQIDPKAGFNLGLLAHVHLNQQWALQPEIYYSLQGPDQKFNATKYHYNLGYVNVPVLLQYMFDNGFRLEGGPQLGILATAHQTGGGPGSDNIKDDFKSFDFAIPVGLGYLTHSGWGVDARYNIGVSNINDNGINEIKNRVFQIGLFYLFDHQHKDGSSIRKRSR